MAWVKSFHIVFVVTWFAGLFYLPRLFVYHAMSSDAVSIERFKVMERKLYHGIMTPSAVLAVALGLWLWLVWFPHAGGWLHAKLALVAALVFYHLWCGRLLVAFREDRNRGENWWYSLPCSHQYVTDRNWNPILYFDLLAAYYQTATNPRSILTP